jgi:hypothetical protein
VKDIGATAQNLGSLWVNNISSQVGGIVGNPDLIPELEMVGDYKQRQAFEKANDISTQISGATSQVTTQLGMQALGVPMPVTAMVQQGIGSATENLTEMAMGGALGPEYEAEKNEVVQHSGDLNVYDGKAQELSDGLSVLEGATHEQGGIPASGGERIFSDRLKTVNGKTFAKEAEELGSKLGKHEKVVNNLDATPIEKRSAQLMSIRINAELDKLFKQQEQIKTQGLEDLRMYGGALKEYALGGTLPFDEVKFNNEALRRELSPSAYRQQLKNYYKAFESEIMAYGGIPPNSYGKPNYNPLVPGVDNTERNFGLPDDVRASVAMNNTLPDAPVLPPKESMDFSGTNNSMLAAPMQEPAKEGYFAPNPPVLQQRVAENTTQENIDWAGERVARQTALSLFGTNTQEMYRDDVSEMRVKSRTPEIFPASRYGEIPIANPELMDPAKIDAEIAKGLVYSPDNNVDLEATMANLKSMLGSEDANKVMQTLAEYSPTMFNLFQGTVAKKDYYDREANNQVPQALREIDASKQYNIDDILEANARGEQNLRSQARSVSRNAAEYMASAMAGTAQRSAADAGAYDTRERFMSQANMAAAQARNMIGEQERNENRAVQQNQLQTDAIKRSHLAAGFTGASDITQRNQLDQAQRNQNVMLAKNLAALSETYANHYMANILDGTQVGGDLEKQLKLSITGLKSSGYTTPESILAEVKKADPNSMLTLEMVTKLMQ